MGRGRVHTLVAETKVRLVSGAYEFWNHPVHPFFAEIPEWFVLQGSELNDFDDARIVLSLLEKELVQPTVGQNTVVEGLLDILFTHIIRRIIATTGVGRESWSRAIHDQQIRTAIDMIHSDCARSWTLDELARHVGLSRAGFALKFKTLLGDTPLHYITQVRMQKAMGLLATTDDKIEKVAQSVGYQDAFSFSKVFKKVVGVPPKNFRLQDRQDRKVHTQL